MTVAAHTLTDLARSLRLTLLLLAMTYAMLAYQKYRFQNGLALGVSLATMAIYANSGRRLGIGPLWAEKLLVGMVAAAATLLLQKLCK